MNKQKHIIVLVVLGMFLPLCMAFLTDSQQRRWWQRKKEVIPPMEFQTLQEETGYVLEITFQKGRSFNHPLMAFWIEDTTGRYIQSLYVAQSIAQGYYRHGDASSGRWQPGPVRRPAALPYWGHQRGIKAPDGYYLPTHEDPMPDAVTGPTPKSDFALTTRTRHKDPVVFNVMMEINQSWNWNHYWHNHKFPGDVNYQTSSQPALVYKATVDVRNPQKEFILEPVGHSHWSGATGELFEDLSTITTALDIASRVRVRVLTDD